MTSVELVCGWCQKPFSKARREYNRRIRNGATVFFCSNTCGAYFSLQEKPRTHKPAPYSYLQKDEFIHFRWFVNRARYRTRRGAQKDWAPTDLTLQYLKEVWEEQRGTCPITGWKLVLPVSGTRGFESTAPINASLDRIDNAFGYVKGNVRFIALIANLARAQFSDEELMFFCQAVTETNSSV
jgi:ribosomal protein L24E